MTTIYRSPFLCGSFVASDADSVDMIPSGRAIHSRILCGIFVAASAMRSCLLVGGRRCAAARRAVTAHSILAGRCRFNVAWIDATPVGASWAAFAVLRFMARMIEFQAFRYRPFVVLVNDSMRLASATASRVAARIYSKVAQPASRDRIDLDAAHNALNGCGQRNVTSILAFSQGDSPGIAAVRAVETFMRLAACFHFTPDLLQGSA